MQMRFNPDIHHRRFIRLKEYDYSGQGAYFITLCTHHRECLFGAVTDGAMIMNDAGQMIDQWWREMLNKYPMINIDAYTVMPNHFHGIIAIVGAAAPCSHRDESHNTTVGAALRGRPKAAEPGQPHRVAPTLGNMIDWFKTMTTNEYIRGVKRYRWSPFPGRFWQRNYYEHIIRNEQDLTAVREYIVNNPAGWDKDDYHPALAGPVDQ
jgi:putative transposase